MDHSHISVFVRLWFCLWGYNLQIFEGHWCWTEVHLIRAFPGNHSSLVASMFMVIDHGQSWSSSLLLVSIDSPSHRRPPSWESIITLPPPPQSQCSDATHLPHHYILSANVKKNILPFPKNTSPFPFRIPWVLLNRISPRSYSSPFIRPPSHSSGQSGLIRWSALKGNMCSSSSPPH